MQLPPQLPAGVAGSQFAMQPPMLPPQPSFLPGHYLTQFNILQHETFQGANICNVWVYNFEHELAKITELLDQFPVVAMVSSAFLPIGRNKY